MPRPRSLIVATSLLVGVAVTGAAAVVDVARHGQSTPSPAGISARPVGDRVARSQQRPPLVPPLRRLTPPDALVELTSPATAAQVGRLRRMPGVRAATALDLGAMTLRPIPGRQVQLRVVGADVAAIRGFTPRFTAASTPLWASVARGEMTVSFSAAGRLAHQLGATVPATSASGTTQLLRIGAFATVGLGDVQAVVGRATGRLLGLQHARAVVVSAPHVAIERLRQHLHEVFGARAKVHVLRPATVNQDVISAYARAIVPATYLTLYRQAASTCRGLPWTVLAAIGTVETGNGRDTRTSNKGAMGPMQFLPSTFAAYAVDGDGDGVANIQDPADAVFSAARYLCLWGAGLGGQSLYAAIFAYNHADWYVREVIRLAIAYG